MKSAPTTTRRPDLRHLNHQVWRFDKNTIRLYLALLETIRKAETCELAGEDMWRSAEVLGLSHTQFCDSMNNLMAIGLFVLQSGECVDPREEPPTTENSKPLILGEGSSK